MRALVLNHCAYNKGDRAVLTFVVRELARNGVDHVDVSMNEPRFWRVEDLQHGASVTVLPFGWNVSRLHGPMRLWSAVRWRAHRRVAYPALKRRLLSGGPPRLGGAVLCHPAVRRALDACDLAVVTGGHHVTTLLGEDAVVPQLYNMGLALLARRPLLLWSQSIGPLAFGDPSDHRLTEHILRAASATYPRDAPSYTEAIRLGVDPERVHLTPESVIGLDDAVDERLPPLAREPVVGISVYNKRRTPDELRRYVEALACLVDHILSLGLTPRFHPMEMKGCNDDRWLISAVLEAATRGRSCDVVDADLTTLDHLREVAACRFYVGHKTHSVIFALVAATPLVAIAYHPKTRDFMWQYGLEHLCLDEDDADGPALVDTFERLRGGDVERLSSDIAARGSELGATVRRDFADMLGSVAGGDPAPTPSRAGQGGACPAPK